MSVKDQESNFYSFMRFDPAYAREVHGFYLPLFTGCERVLDIACGRGEFLDVLSAAGIGGQGVDLDPGMVEAARGAGHQVAQADVFEYLSDHKGAFDGIYSAHLVEHMPYERVMELLRLGWKALRPGGRLAICTPNANSLPTLQRRFWWDATHVRMYDVDLLRFMLEDAGFEAVEGGVNPKNVSGCPIDIEALRLPTVEPMEISRWERAIPKIAMLEDRLLFLNHHLQVVADSLRGLAEALYVPAEIFAAGRKP